MGRCKMRVNCTLANGDIVKADELVQIKGVKSRSALIRVLVREAYHEKEVTKSEILAGLLSPKEIDLDLIHSLKEGEILELLVNADWGRMKLKKLRTALSKHINKEYKSHDNVYHGVNRTFSDEALRKLLTCVESYKYRMLFLTLAFSGLRISECLSLRFDDLHLDEGYISVKTKKQKHHVVHIQPLPSKLLEHLDSYITVYGRQIKRSGGWLFPSKYSLRSVGANDCRKSFYAARDAAGLNQTYGEGRDSNNQNLRKNRKLYNYTLHSFRHWYKSRLDRAGLPYGLVRSLMRHSARNVTDQYGQYDFGAKQRGVDKAFNNFVF